MFTARFHFRNSGVTGRIVTLKFVQDSQDIIKHFLIVMERDLFCFFVFDVDGARILASESVYDDDGSTYYVVKEE